MKKASKPQKPVSAETIARMADNGENISRFFTNKARKMPPVQRVNVDFTGTMLAELDQQAEAMNISRQAVIKALVRQALDQHYVATASRTGAKYR